MGKIKTEYLDFLIMLMMPIVILVGIGGYLLQIIGGSIITGIVALSGIVAILLTQISYIRFEGKKYIGIIGVLVAAVYVAVTFVLFKDGLAITFNALVENYKEIKPYNYVTLYVGTKSVKSAKTIFLAWIAGMCGAGLTISLKKQSTIPFIVSAILWFVTIVIFHEVISPFWLVFSSISFTLWLFHNRAFKGMQTFDAVLAGDSAILIRVLAAALVIVLVFNLVSPADKYNKPRVLNNIEDIAEAFVDDIRYGKEASGLTGGRVYKAEGLERSEDTMLKVTMDKPDSYYLRGFIGETYANSQWGSLDSKANYEAGDMFYWLHKGDFYGLNQLENTAINENPEVESFSMNITNQGACRKYIYSPYETSSATTLFDENAVGDAALISGKITGSDEYELSVLPNQVKRYQYLSSALIEAEAEGEATEYIKNESYYNEYVYKNYTDVPSDIASLLSEYLGQYTVSRGDTHFDYQMAKQNITFFMTNKMAYSEKTEATGRDVDFILNFLDGTKEGYDIHFASAATMMFRYYGIPARYVEGYLITKEDAKNVEAGKPMLIDGTHAHAWVEYYHDGIGWLPFEVTHTYLNIMENPDTMKDISSLLGQYQGEDKLLQEEENSEPQAEDGIQSFLIKYRMLIILLALSIFVLILLALFIWWLVRERRKVAARIASFNDKDVSKGICNIFDYTIDLLLAWGMEPQKGLLDVHLLEINRLMEGDLKEEYVQVVDLRQEAKYSQHIMAEEDRAIVRDFEENIKQKMWQEASVFQKLKYKYMYFL